ncbi:MAG: hypothetical protein AAFZ15_29130 [Bacteroidota bacterium]
MKTLTQLFSFCFLLAALFFVLQSCEVDDSKRCENCPKEFIRDTVTLVQLRVLPDAGCPQITGLSTAQNTVNPNLTAGLKNATVTWNAVANATAYYVELHDETLEPSPTLIKSWTVTTNTLDIDDLEQRKVDREHYHYHIITICDSLHSIIMTDDLVKL